MSHTTCPCCSSTLLRHVRSAGIYWYCSSCHQEMPSLAAKQLQPDPVLTLVEQPGNLSPNYIDWIHQKNWRKVANSA